LQQAGPNEGIVPCLGAESGTHTAAEAT